MADEPGKVERADRRDAERPHRLFGEALVRARENLHLERPEVAARADISYPMLANIEAGRRRASDDIIDRLAPVLGIPADRMRDVRDAADRMRHVRNALAHGRVADVDLSLFLTGDRDSLRELSNDDDGKASASEIERLLSDVLVEQQRAETFALAARPRDDVAFPSRRMQMTSDIIRDLRSLDDTDLAKVRGYVDGLRAARERVATSVSPWTPLPLIRVPDDPFGPLKTWPVPEWLERVPHGVVREQDMSRRVRRYRQLGRHSPFSQQVGTLVSRGLDEIGATDDGSWPLPGEIEEAAHVGELLARGIAKRAGGAPGMVEPGDWRHLGRMRIYRLKHARRAKTLDWVVRMSVVATLLWPDDVPARLGFISRCIEAFKDEVPLIDDEKP